MCGTLGNTAVGKIILKLSAEVSAFTLEVHFVDVVDGRVIGTAMCLATALLVSLLRCRDRQALNEESEESDEDFDEHNFHDGDDGCDTSDSGETGSSAPLADRAAAAATVAASELESSKQQEQLNLYTDAIANGCPGCNRFDRLSRRGTNGFKLSLRCERCGVRMASVRPDVFAAHARPHTSPCAVSGFKCSRVLSPMRQCINAGIV